MKRHFKFYEEKGKIEIEKWRRITKIMADKQMAKKEKKKEKKNNIQFNGFCFFGKLIIQIFQFSPPTSSNFPFFFPPPLFKSMLCSFTIWKGIRV